MTLFSRGALRRLTLFMAVAVFCVLPPEAISRGPDLCLWRRLFHLAACPACGSTRALAAFFHGRLGDALAYNRNVLVTAPALIALAVKEALNTKAISRQLSAISKRMLRADD
jgi:hypothetical protein